MDFERFEAQLERADHTKADLLTMRENAKRKNEARYVHAAEAALDRRFPDWRKPASRSGGAQPTTVEFKGRCEDFPSQKEAFIWLLERFIHYYPDPFTKPGRETVRIAKGPRSLYFARSPQRLFSKGHEHLAANHSAWHLLSNGWYVKLVLNEPTKFEKLQEYASLASLRLGVDWDWRVEGRPAIRVVVDTDELLRQFN